MKNLILLVIAAMFIGGCGTAADSGSWEFDKEVFFAEVYSDCVEMCNLCPAWADVCGYNWTQETTNSCV